MSASLVALLSLTNCENDHTRSPILSLRADYDTTCALFDGGDLRCWLGASAESATRISVRANAVEILSASRSLVCIATPDRTACCYDSLGNELRCEAAPNGAAWTISWLGMACAPAGGRSLECINMLSATPRALPRVIDGSVDELEAAEAVMVRSGTTVSIVAGTTGALLPWQRSLPSDTIRFSGQGSLEQCALSESHVLWCAPDLAGVPWERRLEAEVVALETEGDVGVVLDGHGRVVTWSSHTSPETLGFVSDRITAGFHHACAIARDGTPYCWTMESGHARPVRVEP